MHTHGNPLHTFSHLMGFMQIIQLAHISWVDTIQSLPGPFVEDKQTALIPWDDCEQGELVPLRKETQERHPCRQGLWDAFPWVPML